MPSMPECLSTHINDLLQSLLSNSIIILIIFGMCEFLHMLFCVLLGNGEPWVFSVRFYEFKGLNDLNYSNLFNFRKI